MWLWMSSDMKRSRIMKKLMSVSGVVALMAVAAFWVAPRLAQAAAGGGVTSGEAAPAFTAVDSNGQEHALSDFAGKTVILEWINKDCPFVKKFYNEGHMQGWQEQFTADENVVWLSVCSSAPGKQGHLTADQWNAHIQATGINSTAVLIDESGDLGRLYGAKTTPHIYVIDGAGVLRYQGAIDDTKSTRTSDIEGATSYLALAVEAVTGGTAVAQDTTTPYGCGVKY